MNMMRYANNATHSSSVTVPVVQSPSRLRLNEIVIDSNLKQLILCHARCPHSDDWPWLALDLVGRGDIHEARQQLALSDLSNALVYANRDSSLMLTAPCLPPTIEVGVYDNRALVKGELFFDPYAKVLFVGYPMDERGKLCLRCV